MRGYKTDISFDDEGHNNQGQHAYFDVTKGDDYRLIPEKPGRRIINPSYSEGSEALSPYVDKVSAGIGNYLKEELEIDIENFGEVFVKIGNLGDTYAFTADGGLEEGVKVLGMYNPKAKEITIDKDLYRKGHSRLLLRVIGEEVLHYVQDMLGIIKEAENRYGKNARGLIEGSAASIADDLFGEIDAYPREKEDYRELVERAGKRGAFLFPEEI